jgi:CzcA family heavy metal efflux pump
MTSWLADFVEAHSRALVLVVLSLALAGVVLSFQIPISILPQTDFPRVVILVDNGITPENVQMSTVTRPIEEAVRLVPGITTVRSVTGRGSTEINVFFRWDVDIQNALHLVQGRIAQITPSLPPGVHFYINRLTFSVFPMMGFSITSPNRTLSELWETAYYNMAPRLYGVPGVAEAKIIGGRPPEYHVLVDPNRLNARSIPLTSVTNAIRNSNMIVPAGMIQENYHLYLTTVTGFLQTRAQIENIVVSVAGGTPILVKDIATVVPSEQPTYNIVSADGRPAVLLNVLQQPDGNAVSIADGVRREMDNIRKDLPPDVRVSTFYDQSVLVRESISGVTESILIGLALSVLVLVGFLKNWRTTVVAAVVIPIAALIAIVCLRLFHMSFNLMTLGGLAACIGVVIDDAIVVVENISIHLSLGESPAAAARRAIVELTPALIGATLTPIVVFAPLVFLSGVTAVFFQALALTLVTALFASLILAIFFTPILARLFLKPARQVEQSIEAAEAAGEGRIVRWLTDHYSIVLRWALDHVRAVLLMSCGVVGLMVLLYLSLGSGFLPDMDEGAFIIDYRTPAGTSLAETNRILGHIETMLREAPEVESYSRRTGARLALAIAEPNTGDFLIKLKPKRSRSLEEITSDLRHKIARTEPAIEVEFPHILEDLVGDLAWSPQPIEVKIFNRNEVVGKQAAAAVQAWLPKVRGVVDVVNQTPVIGPELDFRVDQEKAGRAGFSTRDVADLESAMVDGQLASTMMIGERQIGVRVRYPAQFRTTTDTLKQQLVTSPTGVTLPLSSLANLEVVQGQTEIHRENLRNVYAVTARLEGRDLGSAMNEIKQRLAKEVALPPDTDVEFGGLYQIQQESFVGLVRVLLISIILIFIVLVFEFQSFSHPIAILGATILCGSGSLFALFITHTSLNISSFMGIIMVIGIVQKNGILMLDSEQHYSSQGLPLKEAIFEAGRRRLRPILMTALAAILGMAPLALAIGSGAQMLQPLAIAVIGGIVVSMCLSLVVTPVIFFALRRRSAGFEGEADVKVGQEAVGF